MQDYSLEFTLNGFNVIFWLPITMLFVHYATRSLRYSFTMLSFIMLSFIMLSFTMLLVHYAIVHMLQIHYGISHYATRSFCYLFIIVFIQNS